jgi:hypothetical protein
VIAADANTAADIRIRDLQPRTTTHDRPSTDPLAQAFGVVISGDLCRRRTPDHCAGIGEAILLSIANIKIAAQDRHDFGDQGGQRRHEGAEWQHEPESVGNTAAAAMR